MTASDDVYDLRLPNAACEQLESTLQVLLSPLQFDQIDEWRFVANQSIRDLLDGDATVFHLPRCQNGHRFGTEDYDPAHFDAYAKWVAMEQQARGHPAVYARKGVATRRDIWGDALYRTDYYHEFLRPLRSLVSMVIALPQPGQPDQLEAELIVSRDRAERPFGPHELMLGRLIRPALRAGIETWRRATAAAGALMESLDVATDALLLCDRGGRELHRNAALCQLAAAPHGDRLLQAMRTLAATLAPSKDLQTIADRLRDAPLSQTFRVPDAAFRLSTTFVGGDTHNPEYVLVSALPEDPCTEAGTLSNRFGLTPRQAEVAVHLAERRSNQEIAEALFISPHTARHHTEAVLGALGVDDRRDVANVIRRRTS